MARSPSADMSRRYTSGLDATSSDDEWAYVTYRFWALHFPALPRHPKLLAAFPRHWRMPVLNGDAYMRVYIKISAALFPQRTRARAWIRGVRDWKRDTAETRGVMTQTAYTAALRALAQQWTNDGDGDAQCDFLRRLFTAVTAIELGRAADEYIDNAPTNNTTRARRAAARRSAIRPSGISARRKSLSAVYRDVNAAMNVDVKPQRRTVTRSQQTRTLKATSFPLFLPDEPSPQPQYDKHKLPPPLPRHVLHRPNHNAGVHQRPATAPQVNRQVSRPLFQASYRAATHSTTHGRRTAPPSAAANQRSTTALPAVSYSSPMPLAPSASISRPLTAMIHQTFRQSARPNTAPQPPTANSESAMFQDERVFLTAIGDDEVLTDNRNDSGVAAVPATVVFTRIRPCGDVVARYVVIPPRCAVTSTSPLLRDVMAQSLHHDAFAAWTMIEQLAAVEEATKDAAAPLNDDDYFAANPFRFESRISKTLCDDQRDNATTNNAKLCALVSDDYVLPEWTIRTVETAPSTSRQSDVQTFDGAAATDDDATPSLESPHYFQTSSAASASLPRQSVSMTNIEAPSPSPPLQRSRSPERSSSRAVRRFVAKKCDVRRIDSPLSWALSEF